MSITSSHTPEPGFWQGSETRLPGQHTEIKKENKTRNKLWMLKVGLHTMIYQPDFYA